VNISLRLWRKNRASKQTYVQRVLLKVYANRSDVSSLENQTQTLALRKQLQADDVSIRRVESRLEVRARRQPIRSDLYYSRNINFISQLPRGREQRCWTNLVDLILPVALNGEKVDLDSSVWRGRLENGVDVAGLGIECGGCWC
jgi:hypothetical protein